MFALQLSFPGCANSDDISQVYCPELHVSRWLHPLPFMSSQYKPTGGGSGSARLCIKKPAMAVLYGEG